MKILENESKSYKQPDDKEILAWLEKIMALMNNKPEYRIEKINDENIVDTDDEFKMADENLNGALLRAIAQKGLLTGYEIIEMQRCNQSNLTSRIKDKIPELSNQAIVKELVSIINARYLESKTRERELY